MIRKFLFAAMLAVLGIASLAQAQSQPLLTRHTRDAVTKGEVQTVGRVPGSQVMHFDIVLALRHAPELQNFLQDVYRSQQRQLSPLRHRKRIHRALRPQPGRL